VISYTDRKNSRYIHAKAMITYIEKVMITYIENEKPKERVAPMVMF
jgi:hypothetical protein